MPVMLWFVPVDILSRPVPLCLVVVWPYIAEYKLGDLPAETVFPWLVLSSFLLLPLYRCELAGDSLLVSDSDDVLELTVVSA